MKFPFRLARAQKAALFRLAAERNTNASAILRGAVEQLTGVPDTVEGPRGLNGRPWRGGRASQTEAAP